LIDKLWAPHFPWAAPLGAIGGPVWDLTQGRVAVILAALWLTGSILTLIRLISRIRDERRDAIHLASRDKSESDFIADGVHVIYGNKHVVPAVRGVLNPRILLPTGIDELLNPREFRAVLIHELAHARRRDNLIRLLYEAGLCVLWFHPLMWL